jgi:periplasmic protein CpxP/Spy
MSLKSRFFTIFTAAAATAAFATFTVAQESTTSPSPEKKAEKRMKGEGKRMGGKGHFGKRGGMMGMRMGRMGGFAGIELTDAQKEQIKSIREANKPTGVHRDEMKTIAEARRAGTITDAQKERVKSIRQEMMAHRQNVQAQIMAVLTPEQKAQIEQRRTEMQQKRQEFRQNRQEFRQKRQRANPAVTKSDTI